MIWSCGLIASQHAVSVQVDFRGLGTNFTLKEQIT
jgi:hypothetical protein